MIAITGASGKLGQSTIRALLKKMPAHNIVAVVRDPAKIDTLTAEGIQVAVADYDNTAALKKAFQGIDKVLQISTTSIGQDAMQQEKNVIQYAKMAGVKHIIYTGTVQPKRNAFFLATEQSVATEDALLQSGLDYTIFRNSLYMETIPQLIGAVLENDTIHYPAGAGKVSFVSREDIACALAEVLTTAGHQNKYYEITGNHAFTMEDIVNIISKVKQQPVVFMDMADETYLSQLHSWHLPEAVTALLVSMAKGIRHNEFAYVTHTLEKILGRKRMALEDFIARIYQPVS